MEVATAVLITFGVNLFLGGIAYGTLRTKVNANCKAIGEMKKEKFLTESAHTDLDHVQQQLVMSEINHLSEKMDKIEEGLKEDINEIKDGIRLMEEKRNSARDNLATVLTQLTEEMRSNRGTK